MKLPRLVLLQVFLRSFLLQASWNYEQMQSLGLLYAVTPAFRRYYTGAALLMAYRRHLEHFNTHPYLATAVIGALLRLEEQKQQGADPGFGLSEFKAAMVAPCAAMGDAFFWGALRPLVAVAALLPAFQGFWWAPLGYLLLYNFPHLGFRALGLIRGYGGGVRVVSSLQHWRLSDWSVYCKQLLLLLLGVLAALISIAATAGLGLSGAWVLCAGPLLWAVAMLMRRKISPLLVIWVLCLLSLSWSQLR